MTANTVSKWEQTNKVPDAYSEPLADILGIDLSDKPWEIHKVARNRKNAPKFQPAALRDRRLAEGLTIEDASTLADVSPSAWQMWESGTVAPLEHRLFSLAEILNCDMEGLSEAPVTVGAWRQSARLTAGETAQRLGVNMNTYKGWETREAVPAVYHQALAEVLGIPEGKEPWSDPEGKPLGLRERRLVLGLTCGELAERIGTSLRLIVEWESGVPVHPLCRDALAEVLEIPSRELPWTPLAREIPTLYSRRINKGLSQEQLAEKVGTFPGIIGNWERGLLVSPNYRERLSAALDILAGEEPWWADKPTVPGLKEWRLIAGITQKETAKCLGVSASTYGNWERGMLVPYRHRARVASVLDIPIGEEPWQPHKPQPRHRIYEDLPPLRESGTG